MTSKKPYKRSVSFYYFTFWSLIKTDFKFYSTKSKKKNASCF